MRIQSVVGVSVALTFVIGLASCPAQMFIYPLQGQSPEKQEFDQFTYYKWAKHKQASIRISRRPLLPLPNTAVAACWGELWVEPHRERSGKRLREIPGRARLLVQGLALVPVCWDKIGKMPNLKKNSNRPHHKISRTARLLIERMESVSKGKGIRSDSLPTHIRSFICVPIEKGKWQL